MEPKLKKVIVRVERRCSEELTIEVPVEMGADEVREAFRAGDLDDVFERALEKQGKGVDGPWEVWQVEEDGEVSEYDVD